MEKKSYSSVDTKSGRRIGRGWLGERTQALRDQFLAAGEEFSGKHSRARIFRHYVEFVRRAIGEEWICQYNSGDERGRDKESVWGILFWMPYVDDGQAKLYIALLQISARHYLDRKSVMGPIVLAEVTDHAVTRTICRMAKEGDITYSQVCEEFRAAVEQLIPLLFARIQAVNEKKNIECPELIVPTPSGAVTVRVVDSPDAGINSRRRILFTTWLSDRTMQSVPQLRAIQAARAMGSVLLANGKTGTLLSPFFSEDDSIRARFKYD